MPNKLQYVELPIIGREKCSEYYEGINGVSEGKSNISKYVAIINILQLGYIQSYSD